MSELTQQRWAVISERGVEASGVTYDDARTLLRHLSKDNTHGLCLVTDDAAKRDAKVPPRNTARK
jgi:hypothetical protein